MVKADQRISCPWDHSANVEKKAIPYLGLFSKFSLTSQMCAGYQVFFQDVKKVTSKDWLSKDGRSLEIFIYPKS